MMKLPGATYRIQFCPSFTFGDAQRIVGYLYDLGITDIYASPVLRSREGSAHGYDMTDPGSFDPQLGGEKGFERLTSTVSAHGMGWLQDIVPNHMAYHHENRMLMDVLEKGERSPFSGFFDIQWDFPDEQLRGKLMAPFLGENLDSCLRKGEITIELDRSGFSAVYHDRRFPLSISSYEQILSTVIGDLEKGVGLENADLRKLEKCLHSVRRHTDESTVSAEFVPTTGAGPSRAKGAATTVKRLLWDLYSKSEYFRSSLSETLARFNPEQTRQLLEKQNYRLLAWKSALRMINYRRFFDISDLIAVCVEKEEVFDTQHALVLDLAKRRAISGLRVDHVDGLYDPKEYLNRLQRRAPQTLVLVEKILEPGERLPDSWPVQGTTGYDFLNLLNSVFCRQESERQLTSLYRELTGISASYDLVRYRNKKMVAERYLAGDVQNLVSCVQTLAGKCGVSPAFSRDELFEALVTLLAAFPVYRTYIDPIGCSDTDKGYLMEAFAAAAKTEQGSTRALGFLRRLFFRDAESHIAQESLPFIMRFQQLSGPLMAKGLEDTTLYTYNRFIALNEVGTDPGRVGISLDKFHRANEERQSKWPHSMNATSTHDTKRGEDMRARLDVITEITGEWAMRVRRWVRVNAPKKTVIRGKRAPDRNDEYFLYQTLLGAYPFFPEEQSRFLERLKRYMVKVLRESKRNSSWTEPQLEYEKACEDFFERILSPYGQSEFLTDFFPFQKRISRYGIWNSLSQILIKLTAPGIPDIYQGSELWNFSFVDPDNRQAVDYGRRIAYLREIMKREGATPNFPVADLLESPEDGRIKQFVIRRALRVRNEQHDLFLRGRYIPIQAKGRFFDHVVSFARERAGRWVVAVTPRFLTYLVSEDQIPVGKPVWKDTCLILPEPAPSIWTEELTGMSIQGAERLELATVFRSFPLALLRGG